MFRRGEVVSDRQVTYYERLCAPRSISNTKDAVLEVAGQLKRALAQVIFCEAVRRTLTARL